MRTVTAGAVRNRRSALLAALVSLCLLTLTGPVASAGRHTAAGTGDAIAAAVADVAVADVAVAVRTQPERLASAHRAAHHRQIPTNAALPVAVLVAFLLAARAGRRRRTNGSPQSRLLATAGRGPPVTS